MGGSYVAIFVDIILLLLLVAAMVFAIVLNHRLSKLSLERDDMSKTAEAFDKAVQGCQEGIANLKTAVQTQTQRFGEQIKAAEKLNRDMVKITAKASACNDNLLVTVREAQKVFDHLKTIAGSVPTPTKSNKTTTKTPADKLDKLR